MVAARVRTTIKRKVMDGSCDGVTVVWASAYWSWVCSGGGFLRRTYFGSRSCRRSPLGLVVRPCVSLTAIKISST